MTTSSPSHTRIIVCLVAVFALLTLTLTLRVRTSLHDAALDRVAESLQAVAQLEVARGDEALALGLNEEEVLFDAALQASRLRGVIGVRVFDRAGICRTALPEVDYEEPLTADELASLKTGRPSAELILESHATDGFSNGFTDSTIVPLLRVVVPLHAPGRLPAAGAAVFWIDGADFMIERDRLDRILSLQAMALGGAGALVATLLLGWTFRRMERDRALLERQRSDLAHANAELLLAAKTSAVGAIASHLVHGIKDPLAGLEGFVTEPPDANDPSAGEAWQKARSTLARLRRLSADVISVLHEETHTHEEVSDAEVAARALQRTRGPALALRVRVAPAPASLGYKLGNREAGLATLALVNLLDNARDATPRGGEISLSIEAAGDSVRFVVRDGGHGLPEDAAQRLFTPGYSATPEGSGLGLALSRQLARHGGGDLTLLRSDAEGSVFALRMPALVAVAGRR